MTRKEAEHLLQKTFKLSAFYDTQWNTIEKIFNGDRVLLIEKTGFGKSLCFQFHIIYKKQNKRKSNKSMKTDFLKMTM